MAGKELKFFKIIMTDCLCVYRSHFKCWVSLLANSCCDEARKHNIAVRFKEAPCVRSTALEIYREKQQEQPMTILTDK